MTKDAVRDQVVTQRTYSEEQKQVEVTCPPAAETAC